MSKATVGTAMVLAMALLSFGAAARADEWDVGPGTDNSTTSTDNRLFHGVEQVHDLGASGGVADVDFLEVEASARSSYQVVVDGMTGNLDLDPTDVTLVKENGSLVSTAQASGSGRITLTWNPSAGDTVFVRVGGAACGTSCSSQDRYRIRFYETTYSIPRFNNTGTQATVLLVVNRSHTTCSVVYQFFDVLGTFLGSAVQTLPAFGMDVRSVASLNLPGQSGSVRVTHNCGYGGLAGKAVSVEPSTGFTFDTQMVPVE
jgi:hypothetical protein